MDRLGEVLKLKSSTITDPNGSPGRKFSRPRISQGIKLERKRESKRFFFASYEDLERDLGAETGSKTGGKVVYLFVFLVFWCDFVEVVVCFCLCSFAVVFEGVGVVSFLGKSVVCACLVPYAFRTSACIVCVGLCMIVLISLGHCF